MTDTDVTKRLAIPKPGDQCKLAMLFSGVYWLSHFLKEYPTLAYYHFMSMFESSSICGESGAHLYVVDMEIAKKNVMITPAVGLRPVSVTLALSLDQYKEMRENKTFIQTRHKVKEQVMPEFKEVTGDE
ncbi:MAG: hypothetical protein V3T23_01710 [Nitrososphaerales archaeon]